MYIYIYVCIRTKLVAESCGPLYSLGKRYETGWLCRRWPGIKALLTWSRQWRVPRSQEQEKKPLNADAWVTIKKVPDPIISKMGSNDSEIMLESSCVTPKLCDFMRFWNHVHVPTEVQSAPFLATGNHITCLLVAGWDRWRHQESKALIKSRYLRKPTCGKCRTAGAN